MDEFDVTIQMGANTAMRLCALIAKGETAVHNTWPFHESWVTDIEPETHWSSVQSAATELLPLPPTPGADWAHGY